MVRALVFCGLIIALSTSFAADTPLTVGDSDKHVSYKAGIFSGDISKCTTSRRRNPCANQWWEENVNGAFMGSVKTTAGSQSNLQVVFQGSSIAVVGVRDKDGAQAVVSIDGGATNIADFSAVDGQRHIGETVFSSGELNSSSPHTLNLWYNPRGPRGFVRVDSFVITFPDTQASPFPDGLPVVPPPDTVPPSASPTIVPEPTFTQPVSSQSDPTSESTPTAPAIVGTTRSSRNSSIPIVAGMVTGLGTLLVAGGILFWFFRRRRAVPVQSMTPVRSSMPANPVRSPTAPAPAPARGLLSRATYAFTHRGSSVTSSSDNPPMSQAPRSPPPPVPQLTAFVNPYTYRHPYTYPRSEDSTSLGPPVDERPPNVPAPQSPVSPRLTSPPRRLQVFNPDSTTVVSSESGGGR